MVCGVRWWGVWCVVCGGVVCNGVGCGGVVHGVVWCGGVVCGVR